MLDKILRLTCMVTMAVFCCSCSGDDSRESAGKSTGSQGDGQIVARVGDIEISLDEFERHINRQNRLVRSRYKSLEQKKKLLNSLVEREAMVLHAKKLGLHEDPEVKRGLKKILARHLVNQEFNGKRAKQIEISDEAIKTYYEENSDRYHAPEKVRIHRIFFRGPQGDSKARRAAKEKASKALDKLKASPEDRRLFIQLAREISEDEQTKRIAGDTNFKSREEMQKAYGKAVADAAFSLEKTNDISGIIETEDGFCIIRQSGKQPPIDLPLEKVKEQIRTTLYARARGEAYKSFVAEMKKKAGIEIFEEVVDKAKVDLSDVPSLPGKRGPAAIGGRKRPILFKGGKKGKIVPPGVRRGAPAPRPRKPAGAAER